VTVARACVAALALAMLAWLSVMALDDRAFRRGVELSGRVRGPADAMRAERALRDARRMNPDSAPDVARAILYEGRGAPERSAVVLESVLRREPDNLAAWALLYRLARTRNPATARRALAARARLDPLNARPRRAP
jgi:hypothetical protein